ncbi:MAG: hypothetical protein IJL56_06655 [Bacteroidales bacterium]|nr:hypothetical protein [Bacteroidales bacterium]
MEVLMCEDLLELYTTGDNRRYKGIARNPELMKGFRRAVAVMKNAESLKELQQFSWLHYEKLKYGFSGLSSVRLSNRFVHRLLFKEQEDKLLIELIEINETHYGNKG